MDRRAKGVTGLERRFACTQCGKCCNRAPELELGEAADYADTFVLQLLMRIYSLPRSFTEYDSPLPRAEASAEYYESKRLLGQFAAASWHAKVQRADRIVDYVQYLSLSVLPLDLGLKACPALSGENCSIYESRPLSCRSVPLHYSRPAAAARRDLDNFTGVPGFRCATGPEAPLVISGAGIVERTLLAARTEALDQAKRDARWKAALVKAMKVGEHNLPAPRAVEAKVELGALTASMQAAWRVAETAGLIAPGSTGRLLSAQARLIQRELDRSGLAPQTTSALTDLQREYAAALAA
ncbi:MAG: YkgJ family cysteine cluster protein [Novosphingobium sp.]